MIKCPVCGFLVGGHSHAKFIRDKEGKIIKIKFRCSGVFVTVVKEFEE